MSFRACHGVAAGVAAACALLAAACIIADPSTDFPVAKPRRPTIIRDRAVPPTSKVLGEFTPNYQFVLEVEVDPSQTVEWHLFVDYDEFHFSGPPAGLVGRDISLPVTGDDAGVRELVLQADTSYVPDPGRCHVIEALVALGFQSHVDRGAHAFDSRGGDSIVWFYSPTGDLRGCPVYNTGVEPDASVKNPDTGIFGTEGGAG